MKETSVAALLMIIKAAAVELVVTYQHDALRRIVRAHPARPALTVT